jgi:hypothetical protein
MQNPILLKQFEFSMPPAAFNLAGNTEDMDVPQHLPVMSVRIDFENGKLMLEGDWQFLVQSNKHNSSKWLMYHSSRVQIQTSIYPETTINLSTTDADGLVFPLEGFLRDENGLAGTSGLLIVDNEKNTKGAMSNWWNISFYLYDYQFDVCEIKYKLPLFVNNETDEMNN